MLLVLMVFDKRSTLYFREVTEMVTLPIWRTLRIARLCLLLPPLLPLNACFSSSVSLIAPLSFFLFLFHNLLKRAKRICAPPRWCGFYFALWSVKTCRLNRLVLLACARVEDESVIEDFINLVPIALFITYVFE